MKTKLILFLTLLAALRAARANEVNLFLQYEWAPGPGGPFTRVPPEAMRLLPDGSAIVVSGDSRKFFRLLCNAATASGGGGSVPVQPLGTLPAATLDHLRKFMQSVAETDSSWRGAVMSPFITPVTSAWNMTGTPDLAEIKVIAADSAPEPGALFPCQEGAPAARARGYILTSLTRQSPPITGYATRGATPCESLLAQCRSGGAVSCIRRFGPSFLVSEDPQKNPLGSLGPWPVVYPDSAYDDHSQPVDYTWDSDGRENPPLPAAPPRAEPLAFTKFRDLLTAYNASAFLEQRRREKQALIEFEWQLLDGTAPALDVKSGEQKPFLAGEQFTHYWLDDEDTDRPPTVALGGAAGGVLIGGVTSGAWRLTLRNADRELSRHMIVVRPAVQPRGGGETGLTITTRQWQTGTAGAQPRYSQRPDLGSVVRYNWCPSVGCAPVMLALQTAWAEHYQNVPSAFWERDIGDSTLEYRRRTLREEDSPLEFTEDSEFWSSESGLAGYIAMEHFYDYLHDACDVACWANGAGSTLPWDAASTLINFTSYICSPLFPIQVAQDLPNPLVGGSASWTTDIDGDDWDESGRRVANAIKAGRPAGVYYMEHWHYCMAWGYRKVSVEAKANGQTLWRNTSRFFIVNTGWGDVDQVWNAYDIDGSYLLNLRQLRLPPP